MPPQLPPPPPPAAFSPRIRRARGGDGRHQIRHVRNCVDAYLVLATCNSCACQVHLDVDPSTWLGTSSPVPRLISSEPDCALTKCRMRQAHARPRSHSASLRMVWQAAPRAHESRVLARRVQALGRAAKFRHRHISLLLNQCDAIAGRGTPFGRGARAAYRAPLQVLSSICHCAQAVFLWCRHGAVACAVDCSVRRLVSFEAAGENIATAHAL
eukprot:1936978-Pleurochrysis_carterae.AAC.1